MVIAHRSSRIRLTRIAALAAVAGVLAAACSSADSAGGPDTSASTAPREYFGSVVPVDGGVLVGGGLYRDTSGRWAPVEEQALYGVKGQLLRRSTVAPPAGKYWFDLDSAGDGHLGLALSCTVPSSDEPGCSQKNTPLVVIDTDNDKAVAVRDAATSRPISTSGDARVLASTGDRLLIARATSERDESTLEDIELGTVAPDGTHTLLKAVAQSQVDLLCATSTQIFVGVPNVVDQAATGLDVMVLDRKGTTTDTFNLEVPPQVSSGQFACSDDRSYVVMDAYEAVYVAELSAGSTLRTVRGPVTGEEVLDSIVDGAGDVALASRTGHDTVVYRAASSGEVIRVGELSKRWPVVLLADGSKVLTVGAGADPLSDRITLEPVPDVPD